jgi:hypothetical protein
MQPRAPRQSPTSALRTVLVLLTLFVAACSSGNMEVDPPRAEKDFEATDWPTASRSTQAVGCADDDVRVCSYYLPAHNGVRPCIVGYQVCSDNLWSRCTEGIPQDGGAAPPATTSAPQSDAGAPSQANEDAPQADAGTISGN